MKRLSILLLLATVGMSGYFWGLRKRGRGEGPNRGTCIEDATRAAVMNDHGGGRDHR
jgi:hypothetical protein